MSTKLSAFLSTLGILLTVGTSSSDEPRGKEAMAPMFINTGKVNSLRYTPDGARLLVPGSRPGASGGGRGAFVYDAASFGELASLSKWPIGVVFMIADPKNRVIITTGAEERLIKGLAPQVRGDLQIWDAKTYKPLHDLRGPKQQVSGAATSSDGRTLVAVSWTNGGDETIWIWSLPKGELLKAFHGHYLNTAQPNQPPVMTPCIVHSVAFAPDDKTLATGGGDDLIRIWDATNEFRELSGLKGHTDCVVRIAYFPAGDKLASVSWDGSAIVWDLKTRKPLHTIKLKNKRQWAVDVAVSPDGKTIATADNVEVVLWDASTGNLVEKPTLTQPGPSCVAFSPDSKYLAIGFDDYFPSRKPSSPSLGVVQWSLGDRKYREAAK
jgi:WD40 repeat protein